ncbi:MAG: helix-turn-helix transcriptional regulator [Actinocatenispora sp.]
MSLRRRSPTARRRRLAMELRRLREEAGLTIDQVAGQMECSASKISRTENAQVSPTARDVRFMLQIYGIFGDKCEELVQIAREARQKGWWHPYSDVALGPYIGLEAAADTIAAYEALLIPGLLQTREYARAATRAARPDLTPEEIERRVDLRLARQQLLTEGDAPELWLVLDEAVLHRWVGGREIMRDQLTRLATAAESTNVTIQVVPFNTGEHAGMDGAFVILGFPDPEDLDVVYLDNATGGLYLETEEEVHRYNLMFDHLRAAALKPDDSLERIVALTKEL